MFKSLEDVERFDKSLLIDICWTIFINIIISILYLLQNQTLYICN